MITQNYTDFPDHRIKFFNLLRAINAKSFQVRLCIDRRSLFYWRVNGWQQDQEDTFMIFNVVHLVLSRFGVRVHVWVDGRTDGEVTGIFLDWRGKVQTGD
jgi:hypothetical protein